MVWPSGSECATNSFAMFVPPPGRFSMTTCWPQVFESCSPTMRPIKSVGPLKGHDDAHNPGRPRHGARPTGGNDAQNEQGGGRCRIELTARNHHDVSPAAMSVTWWLLIEEHRSAAVRLQQKPISAPYASLSAKCDLRPVFAWCRSGTTCHPRRSRASRKSR